MEGNTIPSGSVPLFELCPLSSPSPTLSSHCSTSSGSRTSSLHLPLALRSHFVLPSSQFCSISSVPPQGTLAFLPSQCTLPCSLCPRPLFWSDANCHIRTFTLMISGLAQGSHDLSSRTNLTDSFTRSFSCSVYDG